MWINSVFQMGQQTDLARLWASKGKFWIRPSAFDPFPFLSLFAWRAIVDQVRYSINSPESQVATQVATWLGLAEGCSVQVCDRWVCAACVLLPREGERQHVLRRDLGLLNVSRESAVLQPWFLPYLFLGSHGLSNIVQHVVCPPKRLFFLRFA